MVELKYFRRYLIFKPRWLRVGLSNNSTIGAAFQAEAKRMEI